MLNLPFIYDLGASIGSLNVNFPIFFYCPLDARALTLCNNIITNLGLKDESLTGFALSDLCCSGTRANSKGRSFFPFLVFSYFIHLEMKYVLPF